MRHERIAALRKEGRPMSQTERARILHVCNGHATLRPLQAAGVPGQFRLSCDPLVEGPCPPLWGDAWRDLRIAFLTGGVDHPVGAPAAGEEVWDDDVEQALSGEGSRDEIVLWYEHDLFDQLLLVRLLALVARHVGPRPALSLVSIDAHPAVPRFKGLGQLTPDQLAALFATRAAITGPMITLGHDAWAAYSAPDPTEIERFLARDLSPLPFVARALRRHLEEYPAVGNGLSRTERHLLELIDDGIDEGVRVWQGLHDGEDCHYVADRWFLRIVRGLAAEPAPLVIITGDRTNLAGMRLSLTSLAREVLQGDRDWLTAPGPAAPLALDRWLGGVHLTDTATAWRWDPVARRLRRP
jgi:hypothetical protein